MARRESMPQIKLSDSQKEKLSAEIKAFYLDERGEEIGLIEKCSSMNYLSGKWHPSYTTKHLMMPKDGSPK